MRHKTARSALSAVSYLFLVIGVIALIEMIARATRGSFHFNFGILGIAIYAGLRRRSRVWRTCALLFTCYGIFTLSFALLICLCGDPPSGSSMFLSDRLATMPANWLSIPLVLVLLVTLWQYRVLTHPAIRRLFIQEPRPCGAAEQRAVDSELGGAVVK
jgi:hypothetical protein